VCDCASGAPKSSIARNAGPTAFIARTSASKQLGATIGASITMLTCAGFWGCDVAKLAFGLARKIEMSGKTLVFC
jgi:hypothetical protein